VGEPYVRHQQERGRFADIVDEAIGSYEAWLLDDDYDARAALDRIIMRMKERRAFSTSDQPQDKGP
jgi:hypothetical protein